ncbi:MAG: hypothetical protein ACLQVM_23875, partial [Terriglobia bacterium]
ASSPPPVGRAAPGCAPKRRPRDGTAAAGLLAQYWNGQGLWFVHLNGLGSTQQFTDWTGPNAKDTLFYPWGQPGPTNPGQPWPFTPTKITGARAGRRPHTSAPK